MRPLLGDAAVFRLRRSGPAIRTLAKRVMRSAVRPEASALEDFVLGLRVERRGGARRAPAALWPHEGRQLTRCHCPPRGRRPEARARAACRGPSGSPLDHVAGARVGDRALDGVAVVEPRQPPDADVVARCEQKQKVPGR